jgi:ESF2/ABP1 family protein
MAKHSKRKREEKHEEEDVDGSSVDDNRSESSGGAGESEEEPLVDEAHSREDDQLPLNANGGDDDVSDDGSTKERKKKKKVRKLSLKKTQDFNAKLRKRGVLYIARIPPRMGPAKVKTLLSEFGPVTRVYLVEEDRSARKRRRKLAGGAGAGGKRYTEGWVEFEDKKVARLVGERLNNTPITNHKRSVHFGDLWNVKYLRKFKWEHLTEKVAYERRIREQKMRIEMMQARRENAAYAEKVEQGMVLDRIEERRKKKGKSVDRPKGRKDRKFRQTSTVEEGASGPAKKAVLGSLV